VDNRRLQVVFNSCTRYVFNLRRFDHLSTHRDELLGMPLFTFYESRVLFIFFKLILTRRPTLIFVDVRNARSVRTSNYIFPSICPGALVVVRGIRLWNQLTLPIKDFFKEFNFEESNENRIKLLMEVILVHNLKGKKIALSVDSFEKTSIFFYAV
jgi:chemotaxis signal transduction protein